MKSAINLPLFYVKQIRVLSTALVFQREMETAKVQNHFNDMLLYSFVRRTYIVLIDF